MNHFLINDGFMHGRDARLSLQEISVMKITVSLRSSLAFLNEREQ